MKVGEISGEGVQVAGTRPKEAENRVGRLRWLRSYISDERGRKFYYEYEASSMETVLEDARNAGLSLAPDAVTQVLEPDMFRGSSRARLCGCATLQKACQLFGPGEAINRFEKGCASLILRVLVAAMIHPESATPEKMPRTPPSTDPNPANSRLLTPVELPRST